MEVVCKQGDSDVSKMEFSLGLGTIDGRYGWWISLEDGKEDKGLTELATKIGIVSMSIEGIG